MLPVAAGVLRAPALVSVAALAACATPAVGRGGAVYDVIVQSVNDRPTATSGPAGFPACTIQVGDRAARVWLASTAPRATSPTLLRADAAALNAGILVETSWDAAVVHEVTEAELAAEAAVVHVPYPGGYHTVELRFQRVTGPPIAVR